MRSTGGRLPPFDQRPICPTCPQTCVRSRYGWFTAAATSILLMIFLSIRTSCPQHEPLEAQAVIFTDTQMLAAGITRRRLPADNEVLCLLDDPRTAELAARWGTTRSAAAVSLWAERLAGAVVAIGNAPTALFHLLELIADGAPHPAAIIGIPVGFVGSAESKAALADNPWDIPWLVVHGRRGGSALCAAAINALARESELS